MSRFTVIPKRKRYLKICTCGKQFYCDGICNKEETEKQSLMKGCCFCPNCYTKESKSKIGWKEEYLCDFRKRLLHRKAKYVKIIEREEVVFT